MSFLKAQASFPLNFALIFHFFSSDIVYFVQKDAIKVKVFETFNCSGKNFSNSLHQFWNVKSSQILRHSWVSWKISPRYLFRSNNIYFVQKKPIKVKIRETFECMGQKFSNSACQFWNDKSIPLQSLHLSSMSWNITPPKFFSSKIYTLLKRSPLKWKFLTHSSDRVKICQISYISFETRSQFLSKFCITLQYNER